MKKYLFLALCGIVGFLTISSFSATNANIPSNCIQYTDECGNMCIRQKNNSRSCGGKTCTTPQAMYCVAETNDVDLDQNKNKINKSVYVPKLISSPNTVTNVPATQTDGAQTGGMQTGSNATGKQEVACGTETKPVCGMAPVECKKQPCLPTMVTYQNECIAKSQGATYIQQNSCNKKKFIKKRRIIRKQ